MPPIGKLPFCRWGADATHRPHRSLNLIFPLSLAAMLLLCPNVGAAILALYDPEYGTCGDVSINGVVLPSADDAISQVIWDWGDGFQNSLLSKLAG